MSNINIGIQLFSVRDEIKEYGVDTVFAALQECGCNTVEFAGFYGLTPCEMKEKLEKYSLRPLAAHIRLDDIEKNLPYIDTLGISKVYIPGYSIDSLIDKAGFAEFVEKAKKIKVLLDERGVAFGYHNHAKEFIDGRNIVYDMTESIPRFSSELDIYWAKAAGREPVEIITSYGDKITALHIKDMDGRAEPSDPEKFPNAIIGEGQCDTEAAFHAARKVGVDTFILEVEFYPCDYKEYIKKSVDNINEYAK